MAANGDQGDIELLESNGQGSVHSGKEQEESEDAEGGEGEVGAGVAATNGDLV
jgi:hypothetical protein